MAQQSHIIIEKTLTYIPGGATL